MVILLAENEVATSVDGSYIILVNTLRCKIMYLCVSIEFIGIFVMQ